MSVRGYLVLACTTLAACSGSERTTAPLSGGSEPTASDLRFDARAAAPHQSFAFVPPLGTFVLPAGAQVDAGLSPEVNVCPTSVATCSAANAVASFTRSGGTGGEQLTIPTHQEFFEAKWLTSVSPVRAGESFRIHVAVSGVPLGTLDIAFTTSSGSIPVGSTALIRFFADSMALRQARGCTPGSGGIIDCDVVQVVAAQGNSATVFNVGGKLAGRITVPAGMANQDHVLQLEHRAAAPAPPPQVPGATQFPYHLSVTTVSADGSPVTIGGSGANVVLCQDPSIDQTLPHALHNELIILRVNGSVVQAMPTTRGAPECSLTGPSPAPIGEVASSAFPPSLHPSALLAGLLDFVRPTPLVALHGGLNTSSRGFSEFTAVLGPNAAASTTTFQQGGLGSPTVVTIQARTSLGTPFPLGGGTVSMFVRGANPDFNDGVDLGGGRYQVSYVPKAAGTDSLYITLSGQPIGAGPLILQNVANATHLVEVVGLINGTGTPGLRVVLEGPTRVEGVTDATGNARFPSLPSGQYEVAVVSGLQQGSVVGPSNPQVIVLPTDQDTAREVVFDIQVPS